jgi:glucokinase
VSALGVGIAGVTRGGWVETASNIGIHRPYDLATRLRGCLDVPVAVVNDTQAAAVAEAASLGPGTAVLLTVGTGIGGAIVADGRLVLGEGAAGDFGHLVMQPGGPECACGGRGCLEQFVSGRVLDEIARDVLKRDAVHAGDLDAAALAGDRAAIKALDQAAATLASALRSITAAADPRVIILGGGLMTGERLLPRLVRERWLTERPAWSPAELRPAVLGPDAGLRGAALLASAETLTAGH